MKWLAGEGSRQGKAFELRSLVRPAIFVPETKTIRELLTELLTRRVHIAMVADEYGGTAGLVTIEDIVEEVFGDIQDEYEAPANDRPEVTIDEGARTAEIDARTYIEDVNAQVRHMGWELPASEEYDTVGGFVTVTLGRIPTMGESFAQNGHVVTILAAEPTRVTKVRVQFGDAHEHAGQANAVAPASQES
jgi:CBS domain containing-hemolysin-like protein